MPGSPLLQFPQNLVSNSDHSVPEREVSRGSENQAPSGQQNQNSNATASHKTQNNAQKEKNPQAISPKIVATGLVAENDSDSDSDGGTSTSTVVPTEKHDVLQTPARPAASSNVSQPRTLPTAYRPPSNERMLQVETGDDMIPARIIEDMPSELSARDAVEQYSQICRHLDPDYWHAIIKHIYGLKDSSRAGMEALSRFAEVAYIRVPGLYVLMCSRYDAQLRQWANRNSAKRLTGKDLEESRKQLQPRPGQEESPAKAHPPTVYVTPATPHSHLSAIPLSPESVPDDGRFTTTVNISSNGAQKADQPYPGMARLLQLQASEQIATGVLHKPHKPKVVAKTTSTTRRKALPIEYTMVDQALTHADATRELSLEFGLFMPMPMPMSMPAPPPESGDAFYTKVQTYPPSPVLTQPRLVSVPTVHATSDFIPDLFQPRSVSNPNLSFASPLVSDPSRLYYATEDGGAAAAASMRNAGSALNRTVAGQNAASTPEADARQNSWKGKGKADGPQASGLGRPSPLGKFQPITLQSLQQNTGPTMNRKSPAPTGPPKSASFLPYQSHSALPPPAAGMTSLGHPHLTFTGLAFPWPRGQSSAFCSPSAGEDARMTDANQPLWTQAPTGIFLSRMAVIHGLPYELVATDPFRIYVLILHLLRHLGLSQLSHTVRLISTLNALPSTSPLYYGGPSQQTAPDPNGDGTSASSHNGKQGWAWIIFNSVQQRNTFLQTYVQRVRAGWLPPAIEGFPVRTAHTESSTESTGGTTWPYYIYSAEDYLGYSTGAPRTGSQIQTTSQAQPKPQTGSMLPPPVPRQPAMAAQSPRVSTDSPQSNANGIPKAPIRSATPEGEAATRPGYSSAVMRTPLGQIQQGHPTTKNVRRRQPSAYTLTSPYTSGPPATRATPTDSNVASAATHKKRKRVNDDATAGGEQENADISVPESISNWLLRHHLHKYEPKFESLKWRDMLVLDDQALLDRGMVALGPRRKMLKLLDELRAAHGAKMLGEAKDGAGSGSKHRKSTPAQMQQVSTAQQTDVENTVLEHQHQHQRRSLSSAASAVIHFADQSRRRTFSRTPSANILLRPVSSSPGSGPTILSPRQSSGNDAGSGWSSWNGPQQPPPVPVSAPMLHPQHGVFQAWYTHGQPSAVTISSASSFAHPQAHPSHMRTGSGTYVPATVVHHGNGSGGVSSEGYDGATWWTPSVGGGGNSTHAVAMRSVSASSIDGEGRVVHHVVPGYEVPPGRMYAPHPLEPYFGSTPGSTSRMRTPSASSVPPVAMSTPNHGGYGRSFSVALPTNAYVNHTNTSTPPPPPPFSFPSQAFTNHGNLSMASGSDASNNGMMLPPPPPPLPAPTAALNQMHLGNGYSGSGPVSSSPGSFTSFETRVPASYVRSSSAALINMDGGRAYQHETGQRVSFAALNGASAGPGLVDGDAGEYHRDRDSSGSHMMDADLSATT
ncbi:unnamed protein product [Tilletia controversa]|nr:unnamed protein product [Tilletia controversa]